MRLLRHLSFSNVIAVLALFVALGGAAYAGAKINGRSIVNGSIGGAKLRNETITARKIKKGTLTGAQFQAGSISSSAIDLTTLGTVPSAQTAQTAKSAGTAQTANSATTAQSADTANSAKTAQTATSATTADSAKTAAEATHATTADSATNADHATNADSATHATEADQAAVATDAKALEGRAVADLTVHCSASTEFYGGSCWDQTVRPPTTWLKALDVCGTAGGHLPSIGELIAFVLRPKEQVTAQVWSGDLADVAGGTETVLTSDENGRDEEAAGANVLGYRCVFPLTN